MGCNHQPKHQQRHHLPPALDGQAHANHREDLVADLLHGDLVVVHRLLIEVHHAAVLFLLLALLDVKVQDVVFLLVGDILLVDHSTLPDSPTQLFLLLHGALSDLLVDLVLRHVILYDEVLFSLSFSSRVSSHHSIAEPPAQS